jgi:hypothetical protein
MLHTSYFSGICFPDQKVSNGYMTQLDTSSADTNHLSLVSESVEPTPEYVWSPDDLALCERIFDAAHRSGIKIGEDCEKAVKRASDPVNLVDLGEVLIHELTKNDVLLEPKNRGIVTFAAQLFESSPNAALQIAGQRLATKVQAFESGVAGRADPVEDLSGQDEDHIRVH